MGINDTFLYLCCCVYLTSSKHNGRHYRSVTCLSSLTVTSDVTPTTISECATLCDVSNREAFSFNIQTGECKIFIEDNDAWPACRTPSDVKYFKLQGDCQSVPVPVGYSLEYPYYGSSARARYRCTNITDQPPVDSCPIVQCNNLHDLQTTPASCSVKDVFNNSLSEYEGGVTCTMTGITCQRWDSEYPHSPNYFQGRSDLGNRCQLEGEHRPWCYTIDPKRRWDFCPVTDLDCGAPPNMLTSATTAEVKTHTEWPYRGTHALAWYRCAAFEASDPVSSCPVTRCDGDLTWSKANVSCSVKDCYDVTTQIYQGRVSCTNTGQTCQRWDRNTPHEHTILSGRSDLQNWCQMAGESKPWCYTTIASVTWEFCAVEQCPFSP